MTSSDILLSQIFDPLRLGLLLPLTVLVLGVQVATRRWPLLAAGGAVVALVLPPFARAEAAGYWQLALIGLLANAALLALVLAIRHVVLRWVS
jgi:hypothetical protein